MSKIRTQVVAEAPENTVESHMTTTKKKELDMKTKVMKFLRDEEGLTIVEYAVAAALISAAVATAFSTLGTTVLGIINGLITSLGGTP